MSRKLIRFYGFLKCFVEVKNVKNTLYITSEKYYVYSEWSQRNQNLSML